MNKRNAGQSADEILQNEFTAYFTKAVQRHKKKYLRKISSRQQKELLRADDTASEKPNEYDLADSVHIMQQIESEALYRALCNTREIGATILFMHAIEDLSFPTIAERLHMSETAVKTVYYRLLAKLKKTIHKESADDTAK